MIVGILNSIDFEYKFNYIKILKTNIIKMKTLILGTLLILAVSFFGCEKTENPIIESDKSINIQTAKLTTYDLGYEEFIADEIRFTSFQEQGLFIMLNGVVLKQVTKDNIKSLTFK